MTASGGWSLHGLLALHARDQRLRGGGGADLGAVDAEDEGFAAALFGGCGRDIGEPLGRAALRPAPRGGGPAIELGGRIAVRSEEHTSELQSLMRISYAVFCLQKKK